MEDNSKWKKMFELLCDYKKDHGNCLVPNRYKPFPQLGRWVSTQRRHYKALQAGQDSNLMTQEHIDSLESIGFVWVTRDPRHVPWEVRVQELLQYKHEHGDCLVPSSCTKNPKLSNWVSNQRQEWKLLKERGFSRLTEERIKILNEMGFVWEAQRVPRNRKLKEDATPNQTKELAPQVLPNTSAHRTKWLPVTNPHSMVISRRNNETQATSYEIAEITSSGLSKPQGGSVGQFEWNKMFTELRCYKSQHGHTFVPKNLEQNKKLGKWVAAQRCEYKLIKDQQSSSHCASKVTSLNSKGMMTQNHIHLLDSIGFEWEGKQDEEEEYDTNQPIYHGMTNLETVLRSPADITAFNAIYSRKKVKREEDGIDSKAVSSDTEEIDILGLTNI